MRRTGLQHLTNKMMAANDKEARSGAIRRVLRTNPGRLEALYGSRYVENLKALSDVMAAAENIQMGRASRVVLNPPMLQLTRTLFGPLSTTQRRITALRRMHEGTQNRLMAELVADPSKVENFIKLNRMEPGTVRYIQTAIAAGLNVDDLDEESQKLASRAKLVERMPAHIMEKF